MAYRFGRILFLLLAVPAFLLAGCGGGGGGGDDGGDGNGTTNDTYSAEIDDTGGEVEATGGSVAGAKVTVPPAALAGPTTITIGPGSNIALGVRYHPVGPAVLMTPHGQTFAVDAVVRVPYDPVNLPAGRLPDEIKLLKLEDGATDVTEVAAGVVPGDLIEGPVDSFSTFQAAVPIPEAQFDATGEWVIGSSGNLAPGDFGLDEGPEITEGVVVQEVLEVPSVTITAGGSLFTGSVLGSTYQLNGSWEEDDGTVAATLNFDLTSEDNGQGIVEWTFTSNDGQTQQNGREEVTVLRKAAPTFTDNQVSGGWSVELTTDSGTEPDNVALSQTTPGTGLPQVTLDTGDGTPFSGTVCGPEYILGRIREEGDLEILEVVTFRLEDGNPLTGSGTVRTWQRHPTEETQLEIATVEMTKD